MTITVKIIRLVGTEEKPRHQVGDLVRGRLTPDGLKIKGDMLHQSFFVVVPETARVSIKDEC